MTSDVSDSVDAKAAERLLRLESVSASYGGPDVVEGLNLTVGAGEIVALVGPNGAGKTTTLNAICGTARVTAGRVTFDGASIEGLPADRVTRLGISHCPQERRLFRYLTGYENLRIGGYARSDRRQLHSDLAEFFATWPVAQRVKNRKGTVMSGGEQQVMAIGRALMSNPKVMLLDEPSLGLAPVLVKQLYTFIGALARSHTESTGMGMLLVEQNVAKVLEVSDRIYVLVNGRIVRAANSRDMTPADVAALFLGTEAPNGPPPTSGG